MAHGIGIGSDLRFGWMDLLTGVGAVVVAALWRVWARPGVPGLRTAAPRHARTSAGVAPGDRRGRAHGLAPAARRRARPARPSGPPAAPGPVPVPERRDKGFGDRLVAAVSESGLTGRGGAGFPTVAKLELLRRQRRRPLLAVNACEGEPASRKDHLLSTTVPHLVLDGAELAARALGASGVRFCVSRHDDGAARSVEAAVGERALGRGSITLCRPPARFVTGEESALVHWLDGGDARPTHRDRRPAVLRAGGRPTLVANAETLAHLSLARRHGAAWFRSVGRPTCRASPWSPCRGRALAHGARDPARVALDEFSA